MRAVAFRALQEAWIDGSRQYWERRARQFEAARPRPGDFHGRATREDLQAQWDRLTATAEACRRRAEFTYASQADFEHTLRSMAEEAAA